LFPVGPPTLFPTANWSPWSSWSTCSSKCQPGESHARSRSCLDNKGNSLSDLTACIILQVKYGAYPMKVLLIFF
jgi:hypothetical protein